MQPQTLKQETWPPEYSNLRHFLKLKKKTSLFAISTVVSNNLVLG